MRCSRPFCCILLCVSFYSLSANAASDQTYYHCQVLDAVDQHLESGMVNRDNRLGQYYRENARFLINRQTGELTGKAKPLFPRFTPEVAVTGEGKLDNFQLIWRDRYIGGGSEVQFLKVQGGDGERHRFWYISSWGELFTGLCTIEGNP